MKIAIPTWRDTRILQTVIFAFLVVRALTYSPFARTWQDVAVCLSVAGLADFLLNFVKYQRWVFPISAMNASVGIFLNIDCAVITFYALLNCLAVGSKTVFRWNGRHIFNPTAFAMLLVCHGFPSEVAPNPARWGGDFVWTILIFSFGTLLAWKADRWIVSLAYFYTFLLGCWIRGLWSGLSFWKFAGVALGPNFQLLMLVLLTDPKTSPNRIRFQALFGIAVGVLDNTFRFFEYRLSIFLAVTLATAGYAIVDHFTRDSQQANPWSELEASLLGGI